MKKIAPILVSILSISSYTLANTIDIYPEVSAKILSISQSNQSIKKGDVLVKFDSRQIDARIDEQRAIVNLKKVILDDALKTLDEDKTLYESTVAPQRELDLAKIEVAKVQNEYNSEVAKLHYLELEKEKYTIHSPFNGIVKKIKNPRNSTNIYNVKSLMNIESK